MKSASPVYVSVYLASSEMISRDTVRLPELSMVSTPSVMLSVTVTLFIMHSVRQKVFSTSVSLLNL